MMDARPPRINIAGLIALLLLLAASLARADAPTTAAAVAKPALSHDDRGTVTITDSTPGALVTYTLDGSDPTPKSGPYLAPIDLSHGGVVKARAFSPDRKLKSDAAEARYEPVAGQQPIPSTLVPVTQNRDSYDWAQRHAERLELMRTKHPELILIGDSITHFWERNPKSFEEHFGRYHAVDLGFGWDRTENVLWRIDHGELDGASPKVAVVMIGTNNMQINTAPEIVAGVTAICAAIHEKLPTTKILLLGIFPRDAKPSPQREKIAAVNRELAKLDGKDTVTYLDIGAKFLEPDGTISKQVMGDYLHPTAKGYEIWAEAMRPTLERLMGE